MHRHIKSLKTAFGLGSVFTPRLQIQDSTDFDSTKHSAGIGIFTVLPRKQTAAVETALPQKHPKVILHYFLPCSI